MIPGSIYFFSASTLDSIPLLINDTFKRIVIQCLTYLVQAKKVELNGYVIMPEHLHLLWRMKEQSVENIEDGFLRFTAQQMKFNLQEKSPAYLSRFERPVGSGQFQFWEKNTLTEQLNSTEALIRKLEFMHAEPLQGTWRLVKNPEDYSYSSAAFYKRDFDPFRILTDYRVEVDKD